MQIAVREGKQRGIDRHRKWQDRDLVVKTAEDYHRDWEAIKEATEVEHVCDLTEDMFLDMCTTLIGKYHESRLEKFRGALKQEQIAQLPEADHWYKTERFRMRFGGMVKEAATLYRQIKSQDAREAGVKEPGAPDDPDDGQRGAIQIAKVVQLATRFKELDLPMYAKGVAVTYAGALRHEELAGATLDDLKRENRKYYIRVTGGKGRGENVIEWVWIEGIDNTMEILMREKEERGHGPLFDGWNQGTAIDVVKWCAMEHGWDRNRRWDWHCLRHGRAVDWREQGMPQEERMRRGRWLDRRTEEWYSRPR